MNLKHFAQRVVLVLSGVGLSQVILPAPLWPQLIDAPDLFDPPPPALGAAPDPPGKRGTKQPPNRGESTTLHSGGPKKAASKSGRAAGTSG
jgi:hypothetical protein